MRRRDACFVDCSALSCRATAVAEQWDLPKTRADIAAASSAERVRTFGTPRATSTSTSSLRTRELLDSFPSRYACSPQRGQPGPLPPRDPFVHFLRSPYVALIPVKTLVTQASKITLSSRAFYSANLGPFAKKVTEMFGFDMVLPMNTGAEAVETAIKLARKWGYEKKGIPEGKAKVLSVEGNFHGRTIGIISMSTDPESRTGFGPFLDNVGPQWENDLIRYNNVEDLERVLERHGKETAAFLVEPIQGEAG